MPDHRPRKHLRFEDWPDTDQMEWDSLFREGDIFEDAGRARHWRPATRQTNRRHYARWLAWNALRGELVPGISPADRVTPKRVLAYATHLFDTLAPCSAASALIGLKVVIKVMAPDIDWRWLMDLSNRLDRRARPSVNRRPAMPALTRSTAPPARSSTGSCRHRSCGASTGWRIAIR